MIKIVTVGTEVVPVDALALDEDMDVKNISVASAAFYNKNKTAFHDGTLEKLANLNAGAFTFRCRVLRWRSGYSDFGDLGWERPQQTRHQFVEATQSHNYVAGYNSPLAITIHDPLTTDLWSDISETLAAGLKPPIWIDLFHESVRRLSTEDLRTSLVDGIVSLESFVRSRIRSELEATLQGSKAILKRIGSWQISDILKDARDIKVVRDLNLTELELGTIRRCFEARNKIVHGRDLEVLLSDVQDLLMIERRLYYSELHQSGS